MRGSSDDGQGTNGRTAQTPVLGRFDAGARTNAPLAAEMLAGSPQARPGIFRFARHLSFYCPAGFVRLAARSQQSRGTAGAFLDRIYAVPEETAKRSTRSRVRLTQVRRTPIGHVDNSHWQSDRFTMAIASTVRHDPCVTLPVAGTRRGDGK
jgi:hypothetical protein